MGQAKSRDLRLPTRSDPMVKYYDMQDKCKDLKVFIRPSEEFRSYRPIVGFQDRTWYGYSVRKAAGNGMVYANPKSLPEHYRIATNEEAVKIGLGVHDLKEKYCLSMESVNHAMLRDQAMDASHVVDYAKARGWCVTLSDIRHMREGECIDVALMDRNWMDVSCDEQREVFPASALLKNTHVTFCRSGDSRTVSGTFTAVEGSGNTFGDNMDVELHVEYIPYQFYPLRKGVLPTKDEQTGRVILQNTQGTEDGTKVDDLPGTALVGWRGVMIWWKHVVNMPPVFCL